MKIPNSRESERLQTILWPRWPPPRLPGPRPAPIFFSVSYFAFFRFGILPPAAGKRWEARKRKKARGARSWTECAPCRIATKPSAFLARESKGNFQTRLLACVPAAKNVLHAFRAPSRALRSGFVPGFQGQLQRRDRVRFSRTSVCLKMSPPAFAPALGF